MRTKLILAALLPAVAALFLSAVAGDNGPVAGSGRTETDVSRAGVQVPAQVVPGEMVATRLEPGLQAIEEEYGARYRALKAELQSARTPEEREAIELRVQDLKLEWSLALANRQFELARLRGDTATEAEILQAIEHMQNPRPPARDVVAPDPAAKAVEGGAR